MMLTTHTLMLKLDSKRVWKLGSRIVRFKIPHMESYNDVFIEELDLNLLLLPFEIQLYDT